MQKRGRENEDYLLLAEIQALALFLNNPSLYDTIKYKYFSHIKYKAIYKAIYKLYTYKESINEISLLREANFFDSSVDLLAVRQVFSIEVDLSSLDSSIEVLKTGSIKYNIKNKLKKLLEKVSAFDPISIDEINFNLNNMSSYLDGIETNKTSKTIEESLKEYEAELNVREQGLYHPSHDEFLDKELTKKFSPGQYILIAGSTGTGKSIYALNIINRMVNVGEPAMYFSLEMDLISTFDRWLAMRQKWDVSNWYDKSKSHEWYIRLNQEKQNLKDKPFEFIDDPNISLMDIKQKIRAFKKKYNVKSITVFIDLITQVKDFLATDSSRAPLPIIIEMAINRLNAIAKTENVCFVCVAQMGRNADDIKLNEVEDVEKLRPSLTNVKNSNALGERARAVLGIFRPKYYLMRSFPHGEKHEEVEASYPEDILEAQILKQSQGRIGVVGRYLSHLEYAFLEYIRDDIGEIRS